MSLILAGYLMVIIILQKKFDFSRVEYGLSAALVVCLLFLPLGLVIKEEINSWNAKKLALDSISKVKVVTENPKSEAPQLPSPPSSAVVTTDTTFEKKSLDGIVQEKSKNSDVDLKDPEVSVSCWKTVFQPPARGEDFTILQALFSPDMLILFVATICGVGGTLTAIDNLGQIGTSLGEEYTSWKLKKKELESVPSRVIVEEPPLPVSEIELPEYSSMVKIQEKEEVGCFSDIFKKPKRGEDYTILQALLSIDMLILFVATFCGLGCSLTSIDNLGQIGESLGYPQHTISTFVSLMSIWNYFGRVCSGFISEKLLLKWKVPRTLMMTLALILPTIGDLIIAFPFSGSVYVASLLIGFSFGVQLTLLFIIISELFGLKYYSTLFNCGQLASPLGSYILNVQVVGRLYDKEALKQLQSKGLTRLMVKELTCIGKQCYRNSFIILACVNLFGALVSLILVKRTMEYYKSDIYKRFRDQMEANEKEMKMISPAEK
ncbi:hypothetical protein MTR67_046821 [Solanum verrucosum]|uniref:NFD4 C-terminal domain-containing protein n=1 Tax=Solanum verrucosum TaxID=315347 RepID=A0AAF0UY57_SOLVR|nr:hypothetical protein MTR67_046821 [Solanum verrucosum]